MFRMEEGITRKHKMSFFSKINPFKRKINEVPQDSKEIAEVGKKRIKLSGHFKRNRIVKYTNKSQSKGRPWWTKIGLSKRPGNNSLTPLKPFGTFSRIRRFA